MSERLSASQNNNKVLGKEIFLGKVIWELLTGKEKFKVLLLLLLPCLPFI